MKIFISYKFGSLKFSKEFLQYLNLFNHASPFYLICSLYSWNGAWSGTKCNSESHLRIALRKDVARHIERTIIAFYEILRVSIKHKRSHYKFASRINNLSLIRKNVIIIIVEIPYKRPKECEVISARKGRAYRPPIFLPP